GRLEAEVIAQMDRSDIYYCAVDKDAGAVEENRLVMESHGLKGRGFVYSRNVAEKSDLDAVLAAAGRHFGVRFDGVSVAVCLGIAEYLDMGTRSNETLARLLAAIHGCTRDDGNLIISQTDYHDRVRFLERGLSWHMRLRGIDEVATEVEKAGWHISVCEHEPMELISVCLASKTAVGRRRFDAAAPLAPPRGAEGVATPRQRRRARSR
ncbi:MAG: hypothetical protein U1E05_07080, partial [Patescibacteria group bacterium]|nr:hypothetical protein [Patescibacteria group bacterium]